MRGTESRGEGQGVRERERINEYNLCFKLD